MLFIELLGLETNDARDGATLQAMIRARMAEAAMIRSRMSEPTPAVQKQPMPTYRGYDDPKTPSEFLMEVTRFAAAEGLNSTVVMQQLLPAALSDKVWRWWNFMGGFEDWDLFQAALQREYGPVPVYAPWINVYPKAIINIPLNPPHSDSNIVDVTVATHAEPSVDASEDSARQSETELPPSINTSVNCVTAATSQDVPTTTLPLTPPLVLIKPNSPEEAPTGGEEVEEQTDCSGMVLQPAQQAPTTSTGSEKVEEQTDCVDMVVQPAQQPPRQAENKVASNGREGLLKDVSSCCMRQDLMGCIPEALLHTMGLGLQGVPSPSWSSRVVLARKRKPPDKGHVIG